MDILLGLQWGDEGKGKIVDFLAPQYNVVARFQGGPNAGHTLHFDGKKHVLHQIPSGIFRQNIQNLVGNGVVLDPIIMKREIEAIGLENVKGNLLISKKTQIIIPTHRALDAAYEKAKGDQKIGSTLKGIGPTYQDKIGRAGLRVGDLLLPDFEERYTALKEKHLRILEFYNTSFDNKEDEAAFADAVQYLRNLHITDSEYFINEKINAGEKVLAEGAQGTLLDIDFGSYPFVTSSNTCTAGACTGLGVAPKHITDVFGIFKAYCTRVGSGPFPTELHDETGEELRKAGNEFGATTGRPRRCGWLDLPALKYAVMINGVTQLFMMKADVLAEMDEVKVCTEYEMPDGSRTEQMPYDLCLEDVKPVYKSFPSWNLPESIETYSALPEELRNYIAFIEEEVGVPITIMSYGPEREATLLHDVWQKNVNV